MGKVESIGSVARRTRSILRATGTTARVAGEVQALRRRPFEMPELPAALYLVPRPERKRRSAGSVVRRRRGRSVRGNGATLRAELLDGAYLLAALGAAALCWWSVR